MLKKIKKAIRKQIQDHVQEKNNPAIASLEYIEKIILDYEKDLKKGSAGLSNKDWTQLNRILQKANAHQLNYIRKFTDTYLEEKSNKIIKKEI